MPTLDDLRVRGEAELGEILAKLDTRHKARVQAAIEQYSRVQDIPEGFWAELQREIEDEQAAAILLLMLAADEWTAGEIGVESQPDTAAYAVLAARQVQATAAQTVGTLRDRLARKIEDQRTAGPGPLGEITPGGVQQVVNDVFSDERRGTIAVDETTQAFSAGQLGARDRITGGDGAAEIDGKFVTIDLIWGTEMDDRVCPRCRPLDGTTEDVWGKVFPNGPGPESHPNCRCFLRPRAAVWPSGAVE